jgi:Glutaredoxin-like domain (DUF836)
VSGSGHTDRVPAGCAEDGAGGDGDGQVSVTVAGSPAAQGTAAARIVVYSSPGCHLCEQAISDLRRLQSELGPGAVQIEERDIGAEEALHRAYLERIPVIELDGEELCEYAIDEQVLRERLESRQ